MNSKWIAAPVLALLLMLNPANATAAMDEGNFIPSNEAMANTAGAQALYHSVEPGDTLWDICQKYQTDLESVKAVNGLDEQSVLSIGQKLQIPGNMNRIHAVKKGETLWDIARKYNVSLEQLCSLNQGVNAENLKIGMNLTLPDSARKTSSVYTTPSRGTASTAFFTWPIRGAITSSYGWRSSGFHHGTDISARYGDSIQAAAAGVVAYTGYNGVYGKMIVIEHSDGSETLYAHLSSIGVSTGQRVKRGEAIGKIGTTGNSTGPHLHFEVKKGRKYVNPVNVLR
ncbi:MAG: M23 family metallopeptidase [Syntrophomonadaceae bacterium]